MPLSSSSSSFQRDTLRHAIRYYHAIGNHRTTPPENTASNTSAPPNENENKLRKSSDGKWVPSNKGSQRTLPATQYGSVLDLNQLRRPTQSLSTTNQPNQTTTHQSSEVQQDKNAMMYQDMPSFKKSNSPSRSPSVSECQPNESNETSSNHYREMTPEMMQQMKRIQYQNGVVIEKSNGTQYQAMAQPMIAEKKQTNYEQYLTVQDLELETTESPSQPDSLPFANLHAASKSYKYSKSDMEHSPSSEPLKTETTRTIDMEKLGAMLQNLPSDPLEFVMDNKIDTDYVPHAQWKHDMIQKCQMPALEGVICDCHTDWNERFQNLCDTEILDIEKFSQLRDLEKTFVCTAEAYARIIVLEQFLPVEMRTIKPVNIGGIAGGEKYICANILFKFAVDSNGLYGGDENAMKAAGHDLNGLINYYHLMIPGFHFPLMTLIDYHGFRLQAIALLPISKDTLIYGSSDGGITVHADNEDFNLRIKQAAKLLNVKPHLVGETDPKELFSCADLEGHLGHDGRFYLLDFARVAPPEPPFVRGANLYKMFRFEFVRWYPKPLCPDAFSMMGKHNYKEHCMDLLDAQKYFINTALPRAAVRLSEREEIAQRQVTPEIHRTGVNCRYIGKMRQLVTPPKVKLALLLEAVIRTLKCHLRRFLRDMSRKIRFGITEKSTAIVTRFLNILVSDSDESYLYWNSYLKNDLQAKFPGVLDDLIAGQPNFCVKGYVEHHDCLVLVITEFMRVTGIRMRESSLKDFDLEFHKHREFEFNSGDILRIESTTKHLRAVDYAEAMVFYYESFECKSVFSRRRLLQLARTKIEPSIACNRQNVFVRLAQVFVEIAKTHKIKHVGPCKAKITVDFDEMRDLLGNAELLCVAVQHLRCAKVLSLMSNVIIADILVFEYKHLKATAQDIDPTRMCFSKLYSARDQCIEAVNFFPNYMTALQTIVKIDKIIIETADEKCKGIRTQEIELAVESLQEEITRIKSRIAELKSSNKKIHELEPPVVANFELSMFEKVTQAFEQLRQSRTDEKQPMTENHLVEELKCDSFKPTSVASFSEAQAPGTLSSIRDMLGMDQAQLFVVDKSKYPESQFTSDLFRAIDLSKLQLEQEEREQAQQCENVAQTDETVPQQNETQPTEQPAEIQPTEAFPGPFPGPSPISTLLNRLASTGETSPSSQYSALPY